MLAQQSKDKDMEKVKSQPKVYFQKLHSNGNPRERSWKCSQNKLRIWTQSGRGVG